MIIIKVNNNMMLITREDIITKYTVDDIHIFGYTTIYLTVNIA